MRHREHLLESSMKPRPRIVAHASRTGPIAARVVGVVLALAVGTLENMAAESGGSARLDRVHSNTMEPRQTGSVMLAVGGPETPHDIGHGRPGLRWHMRLDNGVALEEKGNVGA